MPNAVQLTKNGQNIYPVTDESLITGLNYRPYNTTTPNGMGYKVLDKDTSFASQVTDANTIYEIRNDFDLDNSTVNILSGCVLKFNGGKLKNGTLNGAYSRIDADLVPIFDNITFTNVWDVKEVYPEWFGGDRSLTDNSAAFESAFAFPNATVCLVGVYNITKPIGLTNNVMKLVGQHALGSQRFGISCGSGFSSVIDSGRTIKSMFYCKERLYNPFVVEDVWLNGNYLADSFMAQGENAKTALKMYRCYVFRFYNAGAIAITSDENLFVDTRFIYCGIGIAGEGKSIDYSNPLAPSGNTVNGRPNHTIIQNCMFNRNNAGVFFNYCSDVIISECLFGYNSLYSIRACDCLSLHITGNYIEGDCNYKFFIQENGSDPGGNEGWDTGTSVSEELNGIDASIRAYIRLESDTNAYIDKMFCSNYYIRLYEGAAGDAYTNANVSGFDAIIYLYYKSTVNIDSFRNIKNMLVDENRVGNAYDIISYGYTYENEVGSNAIISASPVRYRNIVNPVSGQTYRYALIDRQVAFVDRKRNKIAPSSIENAYTDGAKNIFGTLAYCETIRGIGFYSVANYSTHNSMKIPFSSMERYASYYAEFYIKTVKTWTPKIIIVSHYTDGTSESFEYRFATRSAVSNPTPARVYFCPNDFVRDNKTCDYIYVSEQSYMESATDAGVTRSAIRVFLVGDDEPMTFTIQKYGSSRPKVYAGAYLSFFDTTLGKAIVWNGSAWVNMDGSALS